ncbi:hypothetical protein DM02DRAFT_623368 [Periconia macrospinosa]|uniref:Uncharacterized protein n=1 Tax=Periconia macrospinosa TaxID=97972 RepID=A0A2V1E9P4_9PLEO|nr:hypothetical protein DM02DRAFT_623368 [Periconia macrospinosa]
MPDPNYDDLSVVSSSRGAITHDEVMAGTPDLPLKREFFESSGHSAISVAPKTTSTTGKPNDEIGTTLFDVGAPGRLVRKSSSMITLCSNRRDDDCSVHFTLTDLDVGEPKSWGSDDLQSNYGTVQLQASRHHDSTDASEAFRQQHTERTTLVAKSHAHGSQQSWRTWTLHGTFQRSNRLSPESVIRGSEKHYRGGTNLPLKSSMKHESGSVSTTPAEELLLDSILPSLRRVKTVNFVDAMAKATSSLLPQKLRSIDAEPNINDAEDRETAYLNDFRGRIAQKSNQAFSYTVPATKSTIADTSITKTNVYVVSEPPDNAPSGSGTLRRRRSSSAGQVLRTPGSPTLYGLESVSSELVDWTRDNTGQDHPFKLKMVVLPNNDDGEDRLGAIRAPPNSKATSAKTSRLPSRNTSDRTSYGDHYNEADTSVELEDYTLPTQKAFSPEVVVTCTAENSESTLDPSIEQHKVIQEYPLQRSVSNLDADDIKFRGHRDSVTLERNRLLKSRGASPELLAHGDSVTDVRRRMHARNHPPSQSSGNSFRSKSITMESLGSLEDR